MITLEMSIERLRSLLDYDPETGIFRWRIAYRGARAGQLAGAKMSNGYLRISMDGKRFLCHRLAWAHFYGQWPQAGIDHRDLMRHHNWIKNLREGSQSQNMANARKHKGNSSGAKGVSWDSQRQKWFACIRFQRQTKYLGRFDDKEQAAEAYATAATALFGQFARLE